MAAPMKRVERLAQFEFKQRLKMDPPLKQDSNQSERTVIDTATIKDMFNSFIDGTEKEFEVLKMQLKEYEERSVLEIERSLNLCQKNADLESKLCGCESKLSKLQEDKLKISDESHEQENSSVAQLTAALREVQNQYDQKTAENMGLQQQLDTIQQEMVTKLDQKVTQVLKMRKKLKRANTLLKKTELEYSKEREEMFTAHQELSDELKWKDVMMANQVNTFIQDINEFSRRCKDKYNRKMYNKKQRHRKINVQVSTAEHDDHPPEKRTRMTVDVPAINPENKPQTAMWTLESLNVYEQQLPSFQDDNMMSK